MFIGAGNLAAKGGRAPDGRGVASPCASKAEDGRRREKKRDTMCKREFPLRMHLQRMQSNEEDAEASSHGDAKGEKIVTKSKDTRERPNNFDEGKMLGFFFAKCGAGVNPRLGSDARRQDRKKRVGREEEGTRKKGEGNKKKTSRRPSSSPFFSPPSRLFSSFPFFLLAPQIEERSGKPYPLLLRRRRHKQWLAKNRD